MTRPLTDDGRDGVDQTMRQIIPRLPPRPTIYQARERERQRTDDTALAGIVACLFVAALIVVLMAVV